MSRTKSKHIDKPTTYHVQDNCFFNQGLNFCWLHSTLWHIIPKTVVFFVYDKIVGDEAATGLDAAAVAEIAPRGVLSAAVLESTGIPAHTDVIVTQTRGGNAVCILTIGVLLRIGFPHCWHQYIHVLSKSCKNILHVHNLYNMLSGKEISQNQRYLLQDKEATRPHSHLNSRLILKYHY